MGSAVKLPEKISEGSSRRECEHGKNILKRRAFSGLAMMEKRRFRVVFLTLSNIARRGTAEPLICVDTPPIPPLLPARKKGNDEREEGSPASNLSDMRR